MVNQLNPAPSVQMNMALRVHGITMHGRVHARMSIHNDSWLKHSLDDYMGFNDDDDFLAKVDIKSIRICILP